MRLENWHLVGGPGGRVLVGDIYGHDTIRDGEVVTTSLVQELSIPKKTAKTKNSEYTLGKPDPLFVESLAHTNSKTAAAMRKEFLDANVPV